MKITAFKCDECGTIHEETRVEFSKRTYIVLDGFVICKECANNVSVFDFVQSISLKKRIKED